MCRVPQLNGSGFRLIRKLVFDILVKKGCDLLSDLSVLISIVAIILAAVSPFASAIISGLFRLKERKLDLDAEEIRRKNEFYDRHRAEVIEQYISAVGLLAQRTSKESLDKFGSASGEIYLYVDQEHWELLDSINEKAFSSSPYDLYPLFIELCKRLSSENIRPKHYKTPNNT